MRTAIPRGQAGKDGYIKKAYADSSVMAQKKAAIQRLVEKVEITEKLEGSEESDKAYYERNLERSFSGDASLIREDLHQGRQREGCARA